jgi:hypothetical protein
LGTVEDGYALDGKAFRREGQKIHWYPAKRDFQKSLALGPSSCGFKRREESRIAGAYGGEEHGMDVSVLWYREELEPWRVAV